MNLNTSCVLSIYDAGREEAFRHKWIESERVGYDLGESAIRQWTRDHWWSFLRARWVEHLLGRQFWKEIDRGDFGLLQHRFHDDPELVREIFCRLKRGEENLDVVWWAIRHRLPMDQVVAVLESLDINSRRLACPI